MRKTAILRMNRREEVVTDEKEIRSPDTDEEQDVEGHKQHGRARAEVDEPSSDEEPDVEAHKQHGKQHG